MRSIFLLIILSSHVSLAYAACGSGFFSSNDYLSDYMKNVLVDGQAIPVYSNTLGSGTSFNNLIIEYEKSDSRAVETGKAISFEALHGAKEFAKIRYSFKGKFVDIPNIRNDLNTNYPHFESGVRIKQVNVEARAIDRYGNILARKIYELEGGVTAGIFMRLIKSKAK